MTRRAWALLLLLAAVGHGQEKKAFTIADHFRVVGVGDLQVSPDGRWVAYVTTHTDLARGTRWSHIWLLSLGSGESRQLTQGEFNNTQPRFSPDGRFLAFISNRDGKVPQVFLLPLAGGEPRQLTHFPSGVSDPVWHPSGSFLAVKADVYPECGADATCHKTIADRIEKGPLTAHLADDLFFRHWDSWKDGTVSHVLSVRVEDGSLRDLTPGPYEAPTFSLNGDPGYAFAPDGRAMVVVSNHDPDPALSTNADLWWIALDDQGNPAGEPTNLTVANKGWDGHPVFSPDGRLLAYRTQRTPGYESDLFRLAVYDVAAGRTRVVSGTFDNWIVDHRFFGNDALIFKAEEAGRTPLYRLDLKTGTTTKVLADATVDAFAVTPQGDIVYSRRAVGEPPELYAFSPQGTSRRQLTRHNDALVKEVDIRPAEELWVDSGRGYKIHVFLVKPHNFDPKKTYPLILNIHGGPQSQWADAYRGDWQVYPGLGYIVAFANPTGSTGYGQAFVDAITRDWGGRVYQDLMTVADHLEKLPFVDANRMGAMGWSYGGYMIMWIAGHTQRFKALAAMMGVYNLEAFWGSTEELWFPEHDLGGPPWASPDYRKFSPSAYAQNFRTPTLVVTGEMDFRVPYTQSLEFFTALRRQGVPARLVVFPKAGHWPSWYEMAFYYLVHADWFHRYLGGGPPPWDVTKFIRNQVFEGKP
ncbi:MAG: S9 family peptidase [Thermoanaerobaculum sp.]